MCSFVAAESLSFTLEGNPCKKQNDGPNRL
jgi:hypothetical protein